jgi:valyl-tRNA synthetase
MTLDLKEAKMATHSTTQAEKPARVYAERYDPKQIEPKWQARWEADGLHRAVIDPSRPKYYALTMLPYPSGDLHIGHWYAMTPSDARARWLRMRGYNVMFPIGFDAFGLPAENAAIQRGIHPAEWTYANIANMRGQLRSMGATWDWARESITAGRSGSSTNCSGTAWPTRRCRPWTGARRTTPPWRASR